MKFYFFIFLVSLFLPQFLLPAVSSNKRFSPLLFDITRNQTFSQAVQAYQKNRPKQALSALSQFSGQPEYDRPVAFYRMLIFTKQNKWDEAIQESRKLFLDNLLEKGSVFLLDSLIQSVIHYDELVGACKDLVHQQNRTEEASYIQGVIFYQYQLYDEALFYFQRAVSINPYFAPAYYGLGNTALYRALNLSREKAWRETYRLPESFSRSWPEGKDKDSLLVFAERKFFQTLKLNRFFYEARVGLANLAFLKEEPEKGRRMLDSLFAYQRSNKNFLRTFATALYFNDELDSALALLRRLERDGAANLSDLFFLQAKIVHKKGDSSETRVLLKKALALKPKDPRYREFEKSLENSALVNPQLTEVIRIETTAEKEIEKNLPALSQIQLDEKLATNFFSSPSKIIKVVKTDTLPREQAPRDFKETRVSSRTDSLQILFRQIEEHEKQERFPSGVQKTEILIQDYEELKKQLPYAYQAYARLAQIYLDQGERTKSIAELRQLCKIFPSLRSIHFQLAQLFEEEEQNEEAKAEYLQLIRSALHEDHFLRRALLRLADLCDRSGQYSEALSYFQQSRNFTDSTVEEGKYLTYKMKQLTALEKKEPFSDPLKPPRILQNGALVFAYAKNLYNYGFYDLAKVVLGQIIQEHKKFAPAYELLADIAFERGQFVEAAKNYIIVTQFSPARLPAHLRLARIYSLSLDPPSETRISIPAYSLDNLELAVASYQRVFLLDSLHFEACLKLGQLYYYQYQDEKAIHYLTRAISLKGDSLEPHLNLASVYYQGQQFSRAVQLLEKIYQHFRWQEGLYLAGYIYGRHLSQPKAMVRCWQQYLSDFKSDQWTKREEEMDAVLTGARSIDDFGRVFFAAGKLAPSFEENPEILLKNAEIWMKNNQYDKAVVLLKKILEIEKNNITALRLLALGYDILNQYEAAIQSYSQLLSLDPNEQQARFRLATIYTYFKKDQVLARKYFRELLELDLPAEMRKKVEESLQMLEESKKKG